MADHLRAILITLHIVAVVMMAAPVPAGGMSRAAWRTPMVQDELAAWAERLSAAGIARTPAALEAELWTAATALVAWRDAAIAPARPYYQHCGTTQSWQLFVLPQTHPARLHIDIRHPGGAWTPLYIARSDEADWQRAMLDTERLRSLLFRLSWPQYRALYEDFAEFMARRAAADFPAAEAIRLRWQRRRTPSPEQVRRGAVGEGTSEGELEVALAGFR